MTKHQLVYEDEVRRGQSRTTESSHTHRHTHRKLERGADLADHDPLHWDGARGKAGRGLHVARLIAERPRVSPLSPEGRAIGQDEFMHVARVPVEMSGLADHWPLGSVDVEAPSDHWWVRGCHLRPLGVPLWHEARPAAALAQVARRNYPPGARHVHIVVLRLAVTLLARGGLIHDVGDGLRPASTVADVPRYSIGVQEPILHGRA